LLAAFVHLTSHPEILHRIMSFVNLDRPIISTHPMLSQMNDHSSESGNPVRFDGFQTLKR
jgi:hypothetical protein